MDKNQKFFLIIVATFIVLIVIYSIYFFTLVRIAEREKEERTLRRKNSKNGEVT